MTDTIRDLLISLSSHMAYMQGQLEARHELDDFEDFYWYRESVLLRQKVTDALADEPAVPEGREPASVIGEPSDKRPTKHELFKLLVQTGGAIRCVSIEWIEPFARAVLARWGQPPASPAERHAAPVPKLALAPANDYKSRWLEEDGVMKPVINWIHTIPIEDKDIFHCAQSSCWCSPKVDKDNPEIILHQALTSAQDGWVLIGEIEAASEKPDSVASPPPSELIAELIPELRKVAEHLRDCNFRGFSNYVARAAELLQQQQVMVPVSVSDALIKAECALSDIAEGEPMTDEGDPLQWAERRCADTLAIIRPTMRQHKIRTSEWPPVPAHALPLPGQEVEELMVELRMMASQAAEACQFTDAENLSRAADLLQRLSSPQPVPVSERLPRSKDCDGEVAELVALLRAEAKDDMLILTPADLLRAAELLQRLSPPQPVPVSERLTGQEVEG